MSYTPTTWTTGDTISASAMNKIEQGIANAGGAMIVTSTVINDVETLDKTFQEIYNAMSSGIPVYYTYVYGTPSDYFGERHLAPIICAYNYNNTETLRLVVSRTKIDMGDFRPGVAVFSAEGLNDYPVFHHYREPSSTVTG